MRGIASLVLVTLLLGGCASQDTVVYSDGFSFANYDYIIVKQGNHSGVYGMDLQLANLVGRHNMHVLGDKEYENLPYDGKKRTLGAQLSVEGDEDRILLGLSLQDFLSGRTVATVGIAEKADLFDKADRDSAFQDLAEAVVGAIQRDRQLQTGVRNPPQPSVDKPVSQPPVAPEPEADRPYILEPDFSD